MTFRHLEIFMSVYQNQSITKASKQLHISQPSVSLAIKELEEKYQTPLFDRMNRQIYPTKKAHLLYNHFSHYIFLQFFCFLILLFHCLFHQLIHILKYFVDFLLLI